MFKQSRDFLLCQINHRFLPQFYYGLALRTRPDSYYAKLRRAHELIWIKLKRHLGQDRLDLQPALADSQFSLSIKYHYIGYIYSQVDAFNTTL